LTQSETVGQHPPPKVRALASCVVTDDIEPIEIANLPTEKTGVEGVIYISTAQASHAPRVEWYPGRPKDKAPSLSVTIEPDPRALNHHLPNHVFAAASQPVSAWVVLNQAALLDFWNNGASWLDDEVDAFKKGLRRI
jgi:hypothetical protein